MSTYIFKYKRAIPSNYYSAVPEYFKVKSGTTKDVLLLRLITGNIGLKHKDEIPVLITKKNLSNFPFTTFTTASSRQMREFLAPFSMEDYIKYSNKFYGRNIDFYTNLLSELSFFIYYEHKSLHQTAFINLYRIYEYVSYSFPMIHSAHYGKLIGSYSNLRSFFVGEKTSEIKFFELFVNKLFQGNPILGITSDFVFNHPDNAIARNCFTKFKTLLSTDDWDYIDRPNYKLTLKNKYLIRLLKNLRNRYFHFAIGGQSNIGTSDIKDPEFFFSCVNENFINWFGRIYKEILTEMLDNSLI